jgi:hypothetical protein
MLWSWLLEVGAGLFGKAGGERLSAASALQEREQTKAQVKARLIESHRKVWQVIFELPEPDALFDRSRSMTLNPLTQRERNALRQLFIHFSDSLSEHRAGRVDLEGLAADIRDCLSYPAFRAAWNHAKMFRNKKTVALVERALAGED